jgi:hypothetical protein
MRDISLRDALLPPTILCGVMLLIAFWLSAISGVDGRKLFAFYLSVSLFVTFVCVVAWSLLEVGAMVVAHEGRPIEAIRRKIPTRLELIVLPCLIAPIFLAGFSTAKSAIPFVVGYPWEAFWAEADRAILGTDAWRITHAVLGPGLTAALAFCYAVVWNLSLILTKQFVAIYGGRRFVATFFTALLLTWIIGGCLMAYAVSAAGPVFAQLGDPSLAARFAPLHIQLNAVLVPDSAVLRTQAYLAEIAGNRMAAGGGGISAMPSMHVAEMAILVLAARGTRWVWPAITLWLLIFVGSIHFGYHYALDGVAGTLIALLCWKAAEAHFARAAVRSRETPIAATAVG